MTAPTGRLRIEVEAGGEDFTRELGSQVDDALDSIVDQAANAFNRVSGGAGDASDQISGALRDAAAAASRALGDIDTTGLTDTEAAAERAAQAVERSRQRQRAAAQEAEAAERDLVATMGRSEATAEDLTRATERYQTAQRNAAGENRDARTAQERLRDATRDLDEAQDQAGDSAGGLGEEFGNLAGMAAGAVVGLAGIAAATDALFEGFDRQSITSNLSAQLDLTAEDSAAAGKLAGDLYAKNYGESFEQVSEATGAVLSSLGNFSDDGAGAIEALTTKALTLSQVFGLDVNEAAQAANAAIRNGLAKDGPEAFDLIGAALQRVPAQMRDELIPVMDEYGGVLGSMGFTGAEAFGLIVNASESGAISMDKAGDAIKEFGIRATDLGDKGAQDALEAMGLSGQEMANQILAGGETAQGAFDRIVGGLRDIKDPAEQAAAATALFGTPLEDLNKADIPLFLAGLSNADSAMGDFTGTVDEMGEAIGSGPAAQLETLKRGLQTALIDVMGRASGFMLEHKGIMVALAAAIGALAVAYGVIRIAAVISATAQGIHAAATGANTAALASNRVAMGAHAVASGVMRVGMLIGAAATGVATAATWAFGAAMAFLTSPIGIVIVIVGLLIAAIVLLWKNSETFRDIVMAVWEGIQTAISYAWESIIKPVFAAFMDAVGWVGDKLSQFWTGVVQPVLGFIGAAFGLLWDGISLYFRLWGAAFEVIGTALSMLWNGVILPVLGWIGDRFVWLWDTIISPVIGWIVGAFNWWLGGIQTLWAGVQAVLGWIGDRFTWLWDTVISPVIGWIIGKIQDVGRGFTIWWETVSNVVGWIWGKIQELGGFFGGIVGFILEKLGNAGGALFDWGKNLIQGLLDGAGSLLKNIGNFFLDKIPGWIKDPFKKAMGIASPSKVFAGYGENLGEGLIAGADSMTDKVQAASQRMADAAADVTMPALQTAGAAPVDVGATAAGMPPVATSAAPPALFAPAAPEALAIPAGGEEGISALGAAVEATATEQIDPALLGVQGQLQATSDLTGAVTNGQMLPAFAALGAGVTATKVDMLDPAFAGIQGQLAWTAQMTADTTFGQVLPAWGAMGTGIQAVKAGSIDPAFAGIQGGLSNVVGAFGTGVQAIAGQWDQMRGAVGRPVRFAIDTVFNSGLVGMWNSVSDLIGTQKMAPYVVGGFAKGTSVLPGYSPGVDNMPMYSADGRTRIDLGGGEGIARPEVVAAFGRNEWDAMNSAAARGGIPAVQQSLGRYAFGGVVDSSLWRAAKTAFPNATMNSALRPGASGYHGKGQAVDLGGPLQQIANWIYKTYPNSAQLIYGPGPFIAEGNTNQGYARNYFRDDIAGHYDHVHWASRVPLDDLGKMISAEGASGGAAETFDVGAFVAAKLAPEREKIAGALAGFQGEGTIGTLPGKVYDSMNAAMTKKIDAGVAAAQAAGGVSMGSSANMMEHAKAIADSAKARGFGREGALIGLMTGLAESGIRILANPAVPESLSFPNEGLGYDHDSVGIFQQRQAGWGTLAQRMNARGSADLFFNALGRKNWRGMDPGAAAQAVQVSAVPDAYNKQRGRAQGILDQVFDGGGVANGRGIMLKDVISPERTLSPRQTEAFERILPLLEGLQASGSGSLTIGGLTLSGSGDLAIRGGAVTGNANIEASRDGKRTVLVNQYIQADNAQGAADEIQDRLLRLL